MRFYQNQACSLSNHLKSSSMLRMRCEQLGLVFNSDLQQGRCKGSWSSGYDVAFTRRRSPVRIRLSPLLFLSLPASRNVSCVNSFITSKTALVHILSINFSHTAGYSKHLFDTQMCYQHVEYCFESVAIISIAFILRRYYYFKNILISSKNTLLKIVKTALFCPINRKIH